MNLYESIKNSLKEADNVVYRTTADIDGTTVKFIVYDNGDSFNVTVMANYENQDEYCGDFPTLKAAKDYIDKLKNSGSGEDESLYYVNYIKESGLCKKHNLEESERYQVRKYDKVGAPYGIYDTQKKKFVHKGEKRSLISECKKRNDKYRKDKEKIQESDEETQPIDHFIERGSSIIPVRRGQTDEEVLQHLEQLGSLDELEPSEEDKKSGKYVSEFVYDYLNGAGGIGGVRWVKNPNYPDNLQESEDGNSNADRIVEEFAKSRRLRDTYYKALTLISGLENDNYIDKDKYDECIKKLQTLYNKRDRSIKEAQVNMYRLGQEEYIKSFNPIRNDDLHYTIEDIEVDKRVDTPQPTGQGQAKTNYIVRGYVTPDDDFYYSGNVSIPVEYNITDEEFDFNPFADIPYSEDDEDLGSELYDAVEKDFENLKNQTLKEVYDSQIS